MEEIVRLDIPDLNAINQKYVYLLISKGVVVYVGKCTFGLSFLHTHKSKTFDAARILCIPEGYDQDTYFAHLMEKYIPVYNIKAVYEKVQKADIIPDEDLISLTKIRSILEKCDLEYKYTNTSTLYSRYIEYTFVKVHKMTRVKVKSRSYVSLSGFRKIMQDEHGIDISRYVKPNTN